MPNLTVRPGPSRREFLKNAALAAAFLPVTGAASRRALPLSADQNAGHSAPEMIEIPQYMTFAALPDRSIIGIHGGLDRGNAVARYSSDDGATWSDPTPLFALDTATGSWSLQNTFLDRSGELQVLASNDANTIRDKKPFYEIRFDIWHIRSRDGRRSWNSPVLAWKGYAGSLLSFLELGDGRVVVPFCYLTPRTWANRGTGFDHFTYMGRFSSSAAYSDDGGQTWHTAPNELKEPVPQIGDDGGIEPIVLELKNGRLWMLIRTQNDRFYESFSDNRGATWTHPVPTSMLSSDSPCSLSRLRDGRVVMFWNNTLRYPYANGGRAVLHGAISEDDGRTWRGYREIAANPLAIEPPPPNGDHGVTYTVPALTPTGKLITSLSTGPGGGTYVLRVDPEWLYETARNEDFTKGLGGWTSFGTRGVGLEADPGNQNRQVLAIRKPDEDWPAGAVWNFPAGRVGTLRLRLRVEPQFGGALIGLTDHFSVPFDDQDKFWNVFSFEIGPRGVLPQGGRIEPGRWHDVVFDWNCSSRRQCDIAVDGRTLARVNMQRETAGASYLRLRSTALAHDPDGFRIASVNVDVGESWK